MGAPKRVHLRATEQEKQLWSEAAGAEGRTLSEWIARTLNRTALETVQNGRREVGGMELDAKVMFGKILGEVYRLQRAAGVPVPVDEATVYGLLRGIEDAIDECLPESPIKLGEVNRVVEILDPYYNNPVKLAAFRGFYDIERELQSAGIDRMKAIAILRYLYSKGSFVELIDKMDSTDSPIECKKFELGAFDQ